MLSIINSGMLSLMVSVGHRTGLFDAMAGMAPSTSAEIASAAGLNERYVREWLGAMATGRIVELDPESGMYHLPSEHAGIVTRAAGVDNLASFAQNVAMLGLVESDIVKRFPRRGWRAICALPGLSACDGGGQRRGPRRSVDRRHPAVGGRIGRSSAGGDRRRRCRGWFGARH